MTASAPTNLTVRDMPQERDYLWDREPLGAKPIGPRHFRDLPIVGGHIDPLECVGGAFEALAMLSVGNLLLAGYLAEDMLGDDRIQAVIDTRLEALACLPLEVAECGTLKRAKKRAQQLTEEWPSWVADSELKKLLFWGRFCGLGLGEILWETSGKRWRPRLKAWDPRNCYWRWDTRSFWVTTYDGPTELRPGNGHWVLYCPHGYARGWMHSLVRGLVPPFLRRSFAYRDWSRYSEIHGVPIKALYVPARAAEEDKDQMVRTLQRLNAEGIVELARAKGEGGEEIGYDLKLVEPTAQSWQGFKANAERDEENISTLVLGQPMTTSSGKGGSFALGKVQKGLQDNLLEADATSIGACLREQMVVPWAVYNWGDPEIAPYVRWSTKAPEDRAKAATTLKDAGTALGLLLRAGLNVDRVEFAQRFGIQLDRQKPLLTPQLDSGAPGDGLGTHEAEDEAEEDESEPEEGDET